LSNNKIKGLAGETVLYGLGSILPRVINFMLVPLHTIHMFSRADYGHITTLYAIVAFVNVVFMFGMETAFFRFATKPGADTRRIFNLAQTVVVVISGVTTAVVVALATPLATLLNVDGRPELIVWITLTMLIDAAVAIPFARLRLEKKALRFASAKIINVLVLVSLNYYFLKIAYQPAIGIGYVILANLLANSFFILFFFRTLWQWRPAFDQEVSWSMVRYAYPVMLTGLAGATNEMFSRVTLESWLPVGFYGDVTNEEALGIFGACYKYAVFMNLGIQAFRYAAEPFFFSNAKDKKSPELFARVNHYFVIVGCLVFLTIATNLDVLKYFTGREYWPGLEIVPPLLLAYLFLGIYYNFSIWFKVTDKTYFGTLFSIAGAVVTIGANYLLIPAMGYLGSAWAALLCYFIMTVSCLWWGQKYYPVPYRLVSDGAYLMLTSAVVYLVNQIALPSPIESMALHGIIILVFLTAIWFWERKDLLSKTNP